MAARKHPSDTATFKYHNQNPNQIHTTDCVFRALSLAMDKPWETVYDELCELGRKMRMPPNQKQVFIKYLIQNGWVKKKQPKKEDGKKYTGGEMASKVKRSRVIIASIGCNHISVIKEKQVWDIWDCSSRCVGMYFEKP